MKKPYRRKVIPKTSWTTEQDIFLIENSSLEMRELCIRLPYTEDKILKRMEMLGLIRRDLQMRKFINK